MNPGILSPSDLEIEYSTGDARLGSQPNWLNQNKIFFIFCLVFVPVLRICLTGDFGFLFRLKLRKMILIWGMYSGTLEF